MLPTGFQHCLLATWGLPIATKRDTSQHSGLWAKRRSGFKRSRLPQRMAGCRMESADLTHLLGILCRCVVAKSSGRLERAESVVPLITFGVEDAFVDVGYGVLGIEGDGCVVVAQCFGVASEGHVGDAAVGVGLGEVGIDADGSIVVGQRLGVAVQGGVGCAAVDVVGGREACSIGYAAGRFPAPLLEQFRDRVHQFRRRRVAFPHILRQAPCQQAIEPLARQLRKARSERRRRCLQMQPFGVLVRRRLGLLPPAQHLVEEAADRADVGAGVDWLPPPLLWGHVARRATGAGDLPAITGGGRLLIRDQPRLAHQPD
jgi:hypothetical protein